MRIGTSNGHSSPRLCEVVVRPLGRAPCIWPQRNTLRPSSGFPIASGWECSGAIIVRQLGMYRGTIIVRQLVERRSGESLRRRSGCRRRTRRLRHYVADEAAERLSAEDQYLTGAGEAAERLSAEDQYLTGAGREAAERLSSEDQ